MHYYLDTKLNSNVVNATPERIFLSGLYARALEFSDAGKALKNYIELERNKYPDGDTSNTYIGGGNKDYGISMNLPSDKNIIVVSIGKSALDMYFSFTTLIAEDMVRNNRMIKSFITSPSIEKDSFLYRKLIKNYSERKECIDMLTTIKNYEIANKNETIKYFTGNHPLPGKESFEAGDKLKEFLSGTDESDLVVFLISGGASSLVSIPSNISEKEYSCIINTLMSRGANIYEINAIRGRIDVLKGGGMALLSAPSTVISFIVSDVINGNESIIGSGPTAKCPQGGEEVAKKYGIRIELPDVKIFDYNKVKNHIILSNHDIVKKLHSWLTENGYYVYIYGPMNGNISEEIEAFVSFAENSNYDIVISGGELSSPFSGNGIGGRCHHGASLILKNMISGRYNKERTYLLATTDGIDGSSEGAAAFADKYSLKFTNRTEISEYIENYDSYKLIKKLKSSLFTGYTGTNVADIYISMKNHIPPRH